jgi:Cu(I)/Ag(I) efflux system membrane protein CusA/SilA
MRNLADLRDAIYHGAVKRVRPKAMTACVIIGGLAPILWSHGTGADVMKRIATPMVGGVITSTIMELLVYPAIYYLWRSRGLKGLPLMAAPPIPPPPSDGNQSVAR